MKVTKKYNELGNDFDAEITCEFCGKTDDYRNAYNDSYWWNQVCPSIKCRDCGKATKEQLEASNKCMASEGSAMKETAIKFYEELHAGKMRLLRSAVYELRKGFNFQNPALSKDALNELFARLTDIENLEASWHEAGIVLRPKIANKAS